MSLAWPKLAFGDRGDRQKGTSYASRGVASFIEQIESRGPAQILDLGSAAGATIDVLGDCGCRLYVENVPEVVSEELPLTDPDDPASDSIRAKALSKALSFPSTPTFDGVLVWDLLTYLERPLIEALMERVRAACKPGAVLYLVALTQEFIPEYPARIQLGGPNTLVYEPAGEPVLINPRLSPRELEQLMPAFRMQHSFLLDEKIQDFLFDLQDVESAKPHLIA